MNANRFRFRAWDDSDQMMYYDVQLGINFGDGSEYSFERFLGNQDEGDYHGWILMQSTGLTDRNGVEVFEKDIVRCCNDTLSKLYVIEWYEYSCGWCGTERTETTPQEERFWVRNLASQPLQIIGNIYQNPELLEADQ